MNRPAARLLSLLLALMFLGRAGGVVDMAACPPNRAVEPIAGHHQHEGPAKQAPEHSSHESCKCVGGRCCSIGTGAGRATRFASAAVIRPIRLSNLSWIAPIPVRPEYVLPPSTAPPA